MVHRKACILYRHSCQVHILLLKLEPHATEAFLPVDGKRVDKLLLEVSRTRAWINILRVNPDAIVSID